MTEQSQKTCQTIGTFILISVTISCFARMGYAGNVPLPLGKFEFGLFVNIYFYEYICQVYESLCVTDLHTYSFFIPKGSFSNKALQRFNLHLSMLYLPSHPSISQRTQETCTDLVHMLTPSTLQMLSNFQN
jgi:hypothetical protein